VVVLRCFDLMIICMVFGWVFWFLNDLLNLGLFVVFVCGLLFACNSVDELHVVLMICCLVVCLFVYLFLFSLGGCFLFIVCAYLFCFSVCFVEFWLWVDLCVVGLGVYVCFVVL